MRACPKDGVEPRSAEGEANHHEASRAQRASADGPGHEPGGVLREASGESAPTAPAERLPLKDLTEPEAIERLAALGATAPESRRIWAAAVKRRGTVAELAHVRQVRRTVLDAGQFDQRVLRQLQC